MIGNLIFESGLDEPDSAFPLIGWTLCSVGAGGLLYTYLKSWTAEFAITNKRVIIRVGVLFRKTHELNLSKVESIEVKQGPLERLMNGGNVCVSGTGTTEYCLWSLNAPYRFRQALMDAMNAYLAVPKREADTGHGVDAAFERKRENLLKLKELLDSGILTQEEFDTEKKKILNG